MIHHESTIRRPWLYFLQAHTSSSTPHLQPNYEINTFNCLIINNNYYDNFFFSFSETLVLFNSGSRC